MQKDNPNWRSVNCSLRIRRTWAKLKSLVETVQPASGVYIDKNHTLYLQIRNGDLCRGITTAGSAPFESAALKTENLSHSSPTRRRECVPNSPGPDRKSTRLNSSHIPLSR